jgi:hypothetical protein
MPQVSDPGLGEAEVKRIVAAAGEGAVDGDEVLDPGDLRAEQDAVVGQPGLLGHDGGAERALEHCLDHHVLGVSWLGAARVLVHQLGEEVLVEGAPVDADADGLAVLDGGLDDRAEVLVVAFGADVARVDPVLGQGAGAVGVAREEQVAVVVEVADDGDVAADVAEAPDDLGDGLRGLVGVDGDADELAAGAGEVLDLLGGAGGVGRIGVRHRLDDDRVIAADAYAADVHGDGPSPHVCHPLSLRSSFVRALNLRTKCNRIQAAAHPTVERGMARRPTTSIRRARWRGGRARAGADHRIERPGDIARLTQ